MRSKEKWEHMPDPLDSPAEPRLWRTDDAISMAVRVLAPRLLRGDRLLPKPLVKECVQDNVNGLWKGFFGGLMPEEGLNSENAP